MNQQDGSEPRCGDLARSNSEPVTSIEIIRKNASFMTENMREALLISADLRKKRAMPFGAAIVGNGVHFRLWAPKHGKIGLKLEDSKAVYPMTSISGGWHEYYAPGANSGTRYRFILPGGLEIPDPASRFQPDDVHGPSEVINPGSYEWSVVKWRGRPWEEFIIYELHVGTFTAEGTFRAAISRLDYLRDLGITAIELMPVGDFPGKWNWGYDGVLPFAPDASYGRPEDLKGLIDAAHGLNIAVILDVVYNHFGPDGNYLPLYSPIFTETHQTPWGPAINYDAEQSEVIRQFAVENAKYWIREYNLDGLRLDAVHAIIDDNSQHVLEEIAQAVRAAAERPRRPPYSRERREPGLPVDT